MSPVAACSKDRAWALRVQPIGGSAFPLLRSVYVAGEQLDAKEVQSFADLVSSGDRVTESVVLEACGRVKADNDAVIIFTSGTSGSPKAVLHVHQSPLLQFGVWHEQLDIRPNERVFSTYPMCWSAGFARLGANFSIGACLVTMKHFDPREAIGLLAKHEVTMITQPGAHLDLRMIEHPTFDLSQLQSVQRVESKVLADAFRLPGGSGRNGYGLTETFTIVSGRPADGSNWNSAPPPNVGRPFPGWSIKIVDPETRAVVARGELGQIAVAGPAIMRGYLGRPSDDLFDSEGYFRTPDLGFIDDDGNLNLSSGIDDLIRSGGMNVSTLEVERELSGFGRVRLVVCIGVPHPSLGQALVACVVPRTSNLIEEDVIAWLRPRLASYKRPRRVVFLLEADFTYTMSRKVRRGHLRDLVVERINAAGGW